ncbi:hypothetical protein J2W59_001889 [Pseudomonas fluorescens]|nr:hypothetical protein [Pseudomonas fluorescens]
MTLEALNNGRGRLNVNALRAGELAAWCCNYCGSGLARDDASTLNGRRGQTLRDPRIFLQEIKKLEY